ncbi:MerR family transcriptional regulator [Salininema proteolyticum]|uniref:MerR family transcriptional regulator n=1 Tax=Salininema proteolyticum TaxID=1607685 RepID=A0ABV8TVF8_9ACTN
MRIGELAERTGATTRALRYYEQQGLLESQRRDNGYRDYDEAAVMRVRNIRLLLRVGLGTEDIGRFGDCLDIDLRTAPACAEALENIEQRMRTIEGRITELMDVHQRLRDHLDEVAPRQKV